MKSARRRDTNAVMIPLRCASCRPMRGGKVEGWLPGAGGGRNAESVFNRFRAVVLQDEKSSGDGWWRWPHDNVNVFNASEAYSRKELRWQVLCVVYYK